MTLNDELTVLRRIPMFSAIRPEALRLLAFTSSRMIYQSGQDLFQQGDKASSACILLSGAVTIHHEVDGQRETIGTIAANSMIGELALFCDRPRQVTVTASITVEALLISKESFQKLMSSCPNTLSNILSELGEQLSRAS
ncbi:cyclic nucleotide-binding domain-containing protein [Granulosicoccus sp. 3-233]|uniref:cyclic nucleotide-binding domain-containing protein n=1 Tax=Granulosicoccus sp. 3-233 TaxID=3417969 RepID=UPI003D34E1E1